MLGRRSRQLSVRMEEIVAAITEHESITAELEAMFAEPWRLENRAQLEASGERYQALKEEERSLWEEWEQVSLEAEDVERAVERLKAD